jgi:tellurite methyltransferase
MSQPESPIRSFRQDDEGHWIAELACGHSQHVRHRPPMEVREWVTTEDGRRGRIGASLPCRYCRMPSLPTGVAEYQRTAIFDATTTPAALRARHTTKAGVWGEIVVVEGRVLYVIEDEKDASFVLRAGLSGPIAPGAPHHVEPYDDARFYVRFLR